MKCPKCGYLRQTRDDAFAPPTECPACGIVYVKCSGGDTTENVHASPPGLKKSSAVDESTLRKARERVERRLRKKTAAGAVDDDQKERMLKQARILAAEGVRKRQQEWQHRQAAEKPEIPETPAVEATLGAELDAAFQETQGPEADDSADRLVFVPVGGAKAQDPSLFNEEAQAPSLPAEAEPELELDNTDPEASLSVEPALPPQEAAEAGQPETGTESQISREEEPVSVESTIIAIAARSKQETPRSEEPPRAVPPDMLSQTEQMESDCDLPQVKAGGLMHFFQAVAWLILVAGVSGAVLSWITLTDVQAGTQPLETMGASNLSLALLLGFAYLAIGVLGFAFFWVSSLIGGQLAEIRGILLRSDPSM